MIAQCNILSSSAGDTNEHMKPRKFHNAAEKTRYLVQEFCSHPTLRESVQLSAYEVPYLIKGVPLHQR
jgi:hypothetical protein